MPPCEAPMPYRRFPVLNLPKAWPTEEGVGKQWFLTPFSSLRIRLDTSNEHNIARPHHGAIVRFVQITSRSYRGPFYRHSGKHPLRPCIGDKILSHTHRSRSLYAATFRADHTQPIHQHRA